MFTVAKEYNRYDPTMLNMSHNLVIHNLAIDNTNTK